jgi:hypothetical protein
MKSIRQWQEVLKAAADRRFPDSGWGIPERVASVQSQLDDVKAALKVERGELTSDDHAHQDPNHRIGALIADILVLAQERGMDAEAELEKVLAWFEKRS